MPLLLSVSLSLSPGSPDHIACIMAHKHPSGANTIPRLVVKIVGSKQVKQFIEEPQDRDRGGSLKKEESPPGEAGDEDLKKPAENQDVTASRRMQDRVDSAVWAEINKVPDRLCVTAPSGDRSRSYVHPKTRHSSDGRAAEVLKTTEEVLL
ncbi:hypothetical protein L3Q82_026074 [Scortum barcoo]|uniref:Uncharacterized protein n=1 Tax=Scortum barcoo TaxID=214431 RepID=A0ACB8WMQ2_9TELE|nr:hypothetical protein L3Q82_026074 [Scortum barcoo]